MKIERKSFVRFAVAVALACYDRPIDQEISAEEAATFLKWVIDMALGPNAADVTVETAYKMVKKNYPVSSKMPLIISVAGVQQHLFWFYPHQAFEEMCDTLSEMLCEIPITCDCVPA